jgi:hypothetical protein
VSCSALAQFIVVIIKILYIIYIIYVCVPSCIYHRHLRLCVRNIYGLPRPDRRKRHCVFGSTSDRDKLRRRRCIECTKMIVEEAVNPCDNVKEGNHGSSVPFWLIELVAGETHPARRLWRWKKKSTNNKIKRQNNKLPRAEGKCKRKERSPARIYLLYERGWEEKKSLL